jgi:hypothetical protein
MRRYKTTDMDISDPNTFLSFSLFARTIYQLPFFVPTVSSKQTTTTNLAFEASLVRAEGLVLVRL